MLNNINKKDIDERKLSLNSKTTIRSTEELTIPKSPILYTKIRAEQRLKNRKK